MKEVEVEGRKLRELIEEMSRTDKYNEEERPLKLTFKLQAAAVKIVAGAWRLSKE